MIETTLRTKKDFNQRVVRKILTEYEYPDHGIDDLLEKIEKEEDYIIYGDLVFIQLEAVKDFYQSRPFLNEKKIVMIFEFYKEYPGRTYHRYCVYDKFFKVNFYECYFIKDIQIDQEKLKKIMEGI